MERWCEENPWLRLLESWLNELRDSTVDEAVVSHLDAAFRHLCPPLLKITDRKVSNMA